MIDEPITITLQVISVFEKLGIRYLIGGSLASAIYGEPRATRDADILADIKPEHASAICDELGSTFNISEEAIFSAIKHKSSFNLIHYDSLFKVDVFVLKDRLFDETEMQRRVLHNVSQSPIRKAYMASVEDIILAKLEWYRQGDEISDRQWRDITGVFKANQGRLDVPYLRKMAKELRVLDLLIRLLPNEE